MLKQVLKNCDLVINLVGILHETRKQKFNQIHSQFPYLLSNLCNEVGIRNLVHVSALGVKERHLFTIICNLNFKVKKYSK